MRNRLALCLLTLALTSVILATGCARTDIVESPKTAFVPESAEDKRPLIVWTSKAMPNQNFDYLGLVKARAWTYEGALDRLLDAGQQLRADAIVDVHYEKIGFLSAMQAFAIKYK
jgi:hypothetical protein